MSEDMLPTPLPGGFEEMSTEAKLEARFRTLNGQQFDVTTIIALLSKVEVLGFRSIPSEVSNGLPLSAEIKPETVILWARERLQWYEESLQLLKQEQAVGKTV